MISALKGVKLTGDAKWPTFIKQAAQHASDLDIWETLVDPSLDEAFVKSNTLEAPKLPDKTDREEYPDNTAGRARWVQDKADWKDQRDMYIEQKMAIRLMNKWILSGVPQRKHRELLNARTPYQKLVALEAEYGDTDRRFVAIRRNWKRTCDAPPKKGANINDWLDNWWPALVDAQDVGVSVEFANHDFLEAVRELLPIWHQHWSREIFDRKKDKTINTKRWLKTFGMPSEACIQMVSSRDRLPRRKYHSLPFRAVLRQRKGYQTTKS